jgi:hypothetical protein
VVRGKTIETEEWPAYCACALAGLGDLPDSMMSRSIIIRMKRRGAGERVEPFRLRLHEKEGHQLRDELATWASCIEPGAWPTMPPGVEDRDADVWEALLIVADAAGGDWPARARRNAVTLVTESRAHPISLGIKLLTDLHRVFTSAGRDHIPTTDVLEALIALDESPWGELRGRPLDARGLSRRLAHYGVRPRSLRDGPSVFKGYSRDDLADPWKRYVDAREGESALRPKSVTSATKLQSPISEESL